ncbi:Hypothetical predicted protein [Lecanosticta acicola]|uniref:Carboxylesterase type B domain-containing protein n=1 Tax=Lecanosticta acicola TaxID=111012 RepID=A0AAI8YWS4_9PEZI|nr:Hypothetical predicted protein [Lecanosticta acicola]
MSTVSFTNSAIEEIKARTSEGVTQFLGLQYATLVDRFAPPVLKQYDANSAIDATKIGPSLLDHAENGADVEQKLFQNHLQYGRSAHRMPELQGLSLNITLPAGPKSDRKLPVLAFIHGGDNDVGSSYFPQYDQARLVKLSVENEGPIIAVSLNYRLNAPGFLTSEEMRNAGYKPNNAIRDQRTALHWI